MSEPNSEAKSISRADANTAGHTPGPWTVVIARIAAGAPVFGFGIRADGKPHEIAATGIYQHTHAGASFTPDEMEANARLIAAAPDLLTALRGMLAPFGGVYASRDVEDAARLAVSKATGIADPMIEGTEKT